MLIAADIESFRQQDGSQEPRLVLTFKNGSKRMVANLTQCRKLAELLGSEAFRDWIGARVKLAAGKASNGKPTIVVVEAVKIDVHPSQAADNPRDQGPVNSAQAMTDDEANSMWEQSRE